MAPEVKKTQTIFISGLFILIPLMVTIVVLVFLFNLFDGWLAPVSNYVLHLTGFQLPAGWKTIPGLGIIATLILIFLAGLFGSNYLGRRVMLLAERIITSIPFVSNVYGGVRQLVKAFSATGASAFKTVVMFEFPMPGQWTVGFLTTSSLPAASKLAKAKLMNVFVPAAPIPSQGLMVLVPENKLKILPITTEEAFKMLATLGLVQKGQDEGAPSAFSGAKSAGRQSTKPAKRSAAE